MLSNLPISNCLPELKEVLRTGHAVLSAPPGSGKTTGVPLALLDEEWLAAKKMIVLEPRRLAARGAAAFMSRLLNQEVGNTVGYQIRFDRQITAKTRIEVVTEGILTRRIQSDPDLSDIGLVIFDEFHERSIHADLALALCLEICALRDDLRLLVMSATLDTEPISRLLGNCPVILGEGVSFPVEIDYLERDSSETIARTASRAIGNLVEQRSGDLLCFLPGAGEIKEVNKRLGAQLDPAIRLSPLYGNLPQKEQDRAILPDPQGRRRIVLATSIAETSLTIQGIENVVDCGWTRLSRFDPATGLSRLETVRVSRAAAKQRSGRAGRLGPGYCLRLWSLGMHQGLVAFHPPEILSVDLAGLVLDLALWGVNDPNELAWLDPPKEGILQQAREVLQTLGALDRNLMLTPIGRKLAKLPLHPRLAHMLLKGKEAGQGPLSCDLAALLSERDILVNPTFVRTSDLQERLRLLHLWRKKGNDAVRRHGVEPALCRRVDRLAGQWRLLIKAGRGQGRGDECGLLLAHAFPDRLARQRPGHRTNYQLSNGRGGSLKTDDPLTVNDFLAIGHMDAGQRQGRIFLAAQLDILELQQARPELFIESKKVFWDKDNKRVKSVVQLHLGQLILRESPWEEAPDEQVRMALLEGITLHGLSSLNWTAEAQRFRQRMICLSQWQPHKEWPQVDDRHLCIDLTWLEPWLTGISKLSQLKRVDLLQVLKGLLDWQRLQELETLAPERLQAPSGSWLRLDYQSSESPVLAVRLQEMFGLTSTPTVCNGRIPVLLHLLSPASRPIQVTSDLAGFWERGYPEVKKELKGRYPKHYWPDDPLSAQPTRGVKRK